MTTEEIFGPYRMISVPNPPEETPAQVRKWARSDRRWDRHRERRESVRKQRAKEEKWL